MHFSLFLIIGKLNWETYKERLKPGRQKTNKLSRKFSNFQNNSIEMQSLQYLFSSQKSITNYQNFWTKFKHILRKKCKPQLHSGRKTTLPNAKIGSLQQENERIEQFGVNCISNQTKQGGRISLVSIFRESTVHVIVLVPAPRHSIFQ